MKRILLLLFLIPHLLDGQNLNYQSKIGDFTYIFTSYSTVKSEYSSKLLINDRLGNEYFTSSFLNKETNSTFRIDNADKIIDLARNIKLSQQQLEKIISDLDIFLELLIQDKNLKTDDKFLQQLWFHYAIIRTQKRKLITGQSECIVDPFHLSGKTNFFCIEDHYISKDIALQIVIANPNSFGQKRKEIEAFLRSSNQESIPFRDLYNISYPISDYNLQIRISRPTRCLLGAGSDWGCCGNYSGCCYLNSGWCLVHDAMCTDCKPRWFCLSGCVPD